MSKFDGLCRKVLLEKRLEALNSGKYTDCSFLVGADGQQLEEVHAVKSIMMMSSGFMEGLFNSPLCPPLPIRLNNVESHIFRLIVEFLHLTELVSQVECTDAVEVAIAADHFLIEPLKLHCFELISARVSVDNVWSVLNRVLEFNLTDVASACNEVLIHNTKECLEQEMFLSVSAESVNAMLRLDRLSTISEDELIKYCWKWAKNQSDPREAMRSLLPGLRLLCLPATSAALLPDFLTHAEKAAVLQFSITKKMCDDFPATICRQAFPRMYKLQEMTQTIISPLLMLANEGETAKFTTNYQISNRIVLKPARDLYLTGFTCLPIILEEASPGIEFNAAKNIFERKGTKMVKFSCNVTLRGLGGDQNLNLPDLPCDSCWEFRSPSPPFLKKGIEYSFTLLFRPHSCNSYTLPKYSEVNAALTDSALDKRVFSALNIEWSSDYHVRNTNGLDGPIFVNEIRFVLH
ncbi:uncharacterized protein LOC132203243 [Neocloeon triangulifer]|uniref:uncharacterized protein LOC132203243 n=1 Tax=Neocloeon triangulifer TaxID=2078957 RepID=UPI00286ED69E|nr:uncharacterized protein LOC132203243 [Neocloeon triangulifer]